MSTAQQIRKARLAMEREFKAGEVPARWAPTASQPDTIDGQTRYGRPGQCRDCGAFRTDGQPPTVHRTDCRRGPNGMELPAVLLAVTQRREFDHPRPVPAPRRKKSRP